MEFGFSKPKHIPIVLRAGIHYAKKTENKGEITSKTSDNQQYLSPATPEIMF